MASTMGKSFTTAFLIMVNPATFMASFLTLHTKIDSI
jgi:hypothetical protein